MKFPDSIALQVWECGEPTTYEWWTTAYSYPFRVHIPDCKNDGWQWTVEFIDQTELRGGWWHVTAQVLGADGTPYGARRAQFVYGKPWPYPSIMVWPDSYRGPIVVLMWTRGAPTGILSLGR